MLVTMTIHWPTSRSLTKFVDSISAGSSGRSSLISRWSIFWYWLQSDVRSRKTSARGILGSSSHGRRIHQRSREFSWPSQTAAKFSSVLVTIANDSNVDNSRCRCKQQHSSLKPLSSRWEVSRHGVHIKIVQHCIKHADKATTVLAQ